MLIALPNRLQEALPILRQLREHGFEAVFVGGSVRDTLLGLPIKDVDIATSAKPQQVLGLFKSTIPTGLAHGTVTVIHDKVAYEVTTYRQESEYEQHRRPETVEYITSLEGDLQRRDFTINAMAIDETGQLIDPSGGHKDLTKGLLRCVGDANARFQEDALRMLRAVRFIGVYGLVPSHHTWRALLRHGPLMEYIAMERVQAELDKMLAGGSLLRALIFTVKSGLLFHLKAPFSEEMLSMLKDWKRLVPAAYTFKRLDQLDSIESRWSAIMIELQLSRRAASQALSVLRFSKQRVRTILSIMDIHLKMNVLLGQSNEESLKVGWYQSILQYGIDACTAWLEILLLKDSDIHLLAEWLHSIEISSLKQLNVRGIELAKHLHKQPGAWVSPMLDRLLFEAAVGNLNNEKKSLLEQASKWHKKDQNNEK